MVSTLSKPQSEMETTSTVNTWHIQKNDDSSMNLNNQIKDIKDLKQCKL